MNEDFRQIDYQLIYSYKLNPQTVFYLGASQSGYRDDYLKNVEPTERNVFMKVSYAFQL